MFDKLPSELTDNILHRLPVKTLIKCTSLSKSFGSLITSPSFISAHIVRNYPSHFLFRYFTHGKQEKYHLEPDNGGFSGFQSQGLLLPSPFRDVYVTNFWFNIVGCVNGVICLVNDCEGEGTDIILWNPSIRKYVRLPQPIITYDTYGGYESACGFGYDSISDDYKVVRLVDVGPKRKATEVEVYSLKTGCWRLVGVGPSYIIKSCYGRGYNPCFLHGFVHWVGFLRSCSGFDKEYVILKFDISAESFEIIELPSILKETGSNNRNMNFFVKDCNGMLALIMQARSDDIRICSVWLMREYGVVKSWTKIFDFNNSETSSTRDKLSLDVVDGICWASLVSSPSLRAIGFRKNGEVIGVKGGRMFDPCCPEYHGVVSIDPVTRGETLIEEIIASPWSFYMSPYVESMALFKEGKKIDDLTEEIVLQVNVEEETLNE